MSEQLLNQHIAVIEWLRKEAIFQFLSGNSYEALQTLGPLTDILIDNGEENPNLLCIDEVLTQIKIGESKINISEPQAYEARIEEYRRSQATQEFRSCLRKIRNYMQKVGYYTMMNKEWKYYDPSAGQTSGGNKYERPPIPTQLSSKALKVEVSSSPLSVAPEIN